MLTLIHYTSGRYDDQCARTHIQFGLLTHDQGKHLQCLASHVTLPQPILPALQSCMLSYLAETHLSFFFLQMSFNKIILDHTTNSQCV